MEFEQYLERDILTFLDSKIYKKENTSIDREEEYGLYLTKDYLKELNYALDNDELTRAKKLFDELKANYSRLPKSSVERKKIYSLLEKMYEKIQNYVRIKEGKIEVIKQGDMEVFKDTAEKFTSLSERMEKEQNISTSNVDDAAKKSELIKRARLPIGIDTDNEAHSKEHLSENERLLDKKKSHDRNSIAVESNISGSTIKDKLEKPKIHEYDHAENTERRLEKSENENILKKHAQHTSKDHIHKNKDGMHAIGRENSELNSESLDWKKEIIDKTTTHLEKLKMHVTDKLLEELRKKLDENSDEQNKKIESLRKEIVKQVIEELDKRLKKEKFEVSNKMEHLRGEILNKVYRQAQHIISSKDNQEIVGAENYTAESPVQDELENEVRTKQLSINKYSGEELRVVYEQAIYYMFDNKYTEAAKLFRKIITVQPNNKAAHIRLQECVERQPELSVDREVMPDLEFKAVIEPQERKLTELNEEDKNSSSKMELAEDIDNAKEEITQQVDNFAEDIKKLQKYDIKHKCGDEELQKMYEEAVYTMFQSNYEEATKIFQQILRIRPENKAARIRLQECKEAMGNA